MTQDPLRRTPKGKYSIRCKIYICRDNKSVKILKMKLQAPTEKSRRRRKKKSIVVAPIMITVEKSQTKPQDSN